MINPKGFNGHKVFVEVNGKVVVKGINGNKMYGTDIKELVP
jgi:hypothetical protein